MWAQPMTVAVFKHFLSELAVDEHVEDHQIEGRVRSATRRVAMQHATIRPTRRRGLLRRTRTTDAPFDLAAAERAYNARAAELPESLRQQLLELSPNAPAADAEPDAEAAAAWSAGTAEATGGAENAAPDQWLAGADGEETAPVATPAPQDKRFQDPDWSKNAAFDFMFQQDPFSGHVVLRSTDAGT